MAKNRENMLQVVCLIDIEIVTEKETAAFWMEIWDCGSCFLIPVRLAAERKGCIFFDAAQFIQPSKADSLHLMPDAHAILAEKLSEKILG